MTETCILYSILGYLIVYLPTRTVFLCRSVLHDAARPRVDVMITIFCDFRQFSAKKMAFSSKPML
jgi:hypothetical protein